jgi:hypothetical protein
MRSLAFYISLGIVFEKALTRRFVRAWVHVFLIDFDYSTLEMTAIITPNAPQARLTQSFPNHVHPRMWTVGVPQEWSGCFSVSFLSTGQ